MQIAFGRVRHAAEPRQQKYLDKFCWINYWSLMSFTPLKCISSYH